MPPREFKLFDNGTDIDKFFDSNDDIRMFEATLGESMDVITKLLVSSKDDWKEFFKAVIKLASICNHANVQESLKNGLLNKVLIGATLKTNWTSAMNRSSLLHTEPYRTISRYGMDLYRLCGEYQEGDFAIRSVNAIESNADENVYELPEIDAVMNAEDIPSAPSADSESKPTDTANVSVTKASKGKKPSKSRLINLHS